jgi:hypothetical protein
MKDIIRRNITRRAFEGLCRLQVCLLATLRFANTIYGLDK